MNRLNKTLNRSINNPTGRLSKKLALALAAVVASAAPAGAFNIDFTYQSPMSDAEITAIEMAGLYWESLLTDDINVNFHVGRASDFNIEEFDLNPNVLGAAVPSSTNKIKYDEFKTALIQDGKSLDDQTAYNNLTGDDKKYNMLIDGKVKSSQKMSMTYANAMAVGEADDSDNGLHGAIIFNDDGSINWNYDDTVDPGEKDLVSTIAHEIGHGLGFVNTSSKEKSSTPLNLYRYSENSSSQDAIESTEGAETFFSIDGNGTPIANFGTGEGTAASHWENETGIMGEYEDAGQRVEAITQDLQAMDVIGYDLSGNSTADWAALRTAAENQENGAIVNREEEVEDIMKKNELFGGVCQPFCGQTAAAAEAEAVPEPGVTTGLLGLGFVGGVGSLLKRGRKS